MKSLVSVLSLSAILNISMCLSAYAGNTVPTASSADKPEARLPEPSSAESVIIPGPLRSFLRMAGISQKISPREVLPLLAHNVFSIGYRSGRPTEFLILLNRYVHQARELAALAGPGETINVANCDQVKPLLQIIGYRLRDECGKSTSSLVTSDADRAFLTIDSGFPLTDLEMALQKGGPFAYAFPSTRVPVQFTEKEWMIVSPEHAKNTQDLVDALFHDPLLARLYWAMTRTDAETRLGLRQSPGLAKLYPSAGVLDFYGSYICVRSGGVIVPGGSQAEPAWESLVGAKTHSPGEFVPRLLGKDKGWLAAYFDALSRVQPSRQSYFTEEHRLKRFYQAFRSPDSSADAARPTFRPAPALLLLVSRVRWESDGQPYIPGNLEVWKQILRGRNDSKVAHDWGKRAIRWNNPEQLLEAMFAFSREETDAGPLQSYLLLSELDKNRSQDKRLRPETVLLLASKFAQFSHQYLIFSEFPQLSDESIVSFLNVAEGLGGIRDHTVRGNAMGTLQANVGLWQILARQGQISPTELNDSWNKVVTPFAKVSSSAQLFDAGRNSLEALTLAATGKPNCSQDEFIDLLAGPTQETPDGQRIHRELASEIRSIMDSQRLVSLDTLLALGNGLNEMAKGARVGDSLIPLAGELREFQMPRPIFTGGERTKWAAGIYNNRHTELQMRTDLTKTIRAPDSPAQLEEARGKLTAFLRDTLVGLNYAYYEPPGAQVLHTNPLFVRSHDFSGDTVAGVEHLWQAPELFGVGSPAGGGAHFVGSLADLPYALAEVEQDFIAPENVQALIWRELVPGLLTSATLPRWWNVTRNELHAIALYQRSGEELLTGSVENDELRNKVMNILSSRMDPQRLERIGQALRDGELAEMFPQIMPADTFYLAAEFREEFPKERDSWGPASQELERLSHQYPEELSWTRLSHDFGVSHPILAQSYARELLNVQPFPAFEGYSSRLLAESWDSNNLYWARLADQMGYSPVVLNRLVPELTRRMVENVFGTDLEDWPAVLRALRETGEEFRQGKIASVAAPVAVP
jgi:hypothetical protein